MFAVIDCGTTNTRVYIVNEQHKIIATGERRVGVRNTSMTGSKDALRNGLYEAISEAVANANLKISDIPFAIASGMITSEISLKKVAEASPGATDIPIMENIFLEVAMALQPIHSLNLLHRDISPDNILIMSDDSVKLIDFGAARYVSSGKGSDLSVILKPGFAPYEQYSSKGVQGPWTDIYALAGTIYYCLVGKKIPDAISRLGVTREFSNIIDRCLRVSGAERYQSVTELISDYKHTMLIKSEPLPQPKPILKGKSVFAQIVSGAFDGYLFKMEDSGIMNIGRSSRMCDAVIPANDISRLHCRVIYDKASGALLVTDLSSLGTYRENGTRLPLNTAVRVGFLEKIYLTNRNYTLQFIISYKN